LPPGRTGNTLHLCANRQQSRTIYTDHIDKTHEMSDRLLVSEHSPPDDLEEFIDPLERNV